MESIPYEILQQIASYLLPRSRCKLALTSKWCYQYIYSDLLRWHAKRALIPIPRCVYKKLPNGTVSIIEIGKLVVYDSNESPNDLFIDNYTNKTNITYRRNYRRDYTSDKLGKLWDFLAHHDNLDLLDGFCKYMHRDILLAYVMLKIPLFRLPYHLKNKITDYVPYKTIARIRLTTPIAEHVF